MQSRPCRVTRKKSETRDDVLAFPTRLLGSVKLRCACQSMNVRVHDWEHKQEKLRQEKQRTTVNQRLSPSKVHQWMIASTKRVLNHQGRSDIE